MTARRFAPRPSDGALVPVSSPIGEVITLPTKAGTPTDADVPGGASDGDTIVDTTASKIWIRIGGTWKQTVALT